MSERHSTLPSAMLLETLMSLTPDGVAIIDESQTVLKTNTRFAEITQMNQEQLTGQSVSSILGVFGDMAQDTWHRLLTRCINTEAPVKEKLTRILNGKVHTYAVEMRRLPRSQESSRVFFVSHWRDVSVDLKLAHAIEDKVKADEANGIKSQFLANISHELRTPLNCIFVFCKLLKEHSGTKLSNQESEFLDSIQKAGNDLARLVDEILDLSKVEAGKMNFDSGYIQTSLFAEVLYREFKPIVEEKGLSFVVKLAEDVPPHFFADETRVYQIIKNLLSNATKFTPSGTVTVSFFNHNIRPQEILIEVEDTGIGIPMERQQTIFDAYQQVDEPIVARQKGTGLGLTISNKIAGAMGGTLTVESQLEKGSTFTLALPVNGTPNSKPSFAPIPEPHFSTSPDRDVDLLLNDANKELFMNKDILLVDDDIRIIFALSGLLERMGFNVTAARNGKEALDCLSKQHFQAVLMDIIMPEMDGLTTMRTIRNRLGKTDLPIIAISASAMPDDKKACFESGADYHLAKPLDIEYLTAILKTQIDDNSKSHPQQERPLN